MPGTAPTLSATVLEAEAQRATNEPLLSVRDLHTAFETDRGLVRAVDGVSFEVARGETLGIVGESGAGKTVLTRSMMGLLPTAGVNRSGEVLFDGRDLLQLSRAQMREVLGEDISMVFQDPMTSLHPIMRLGKQITEPLHLHQKISKADADQRAIDLLRSLHVPEPEHRLRQFAHELSGGMRQRVMIAIALICRPKLLIADEPTTALDVTVGAQVLDLLDEQQHDLGMAVIHVTHDLGVVASRTDRIAVMYAGKIVEIAPTSALFRETRMPYTAALMDSAPSAAAPGARLKPISGRPPDLVSPPPGCRFAPRCVRAQQRCTNEEPSLVDADTPGHQYACWYPLDPPAVRVGSAPVRVSDEQVGEGTS